MSEIMAFESPHGVVRVETSLARTSGVSGSYREKGVVDSFERSGQTFAEAMSSFRALANNLADVVGRLDVRPSEVSFEVGLKMVGAVGFVVAKAGAETEMRVSLTWSPRRSSESV